MYNADFHQSTTEPVDDKSLNLVENAVAFLSHPTICDEPVDKKSKFLSLKGLTPQQISIAIEEAASKKFTKSQLDIANNEKNEQKSENWWFLSTAKFLLSTFAITSASYSLFYLFRYLLHQSPSESHDEQEKKKKFFGLFNSSSNSQLSSLQQQTSSLSTQISSHLTGTNQRLKDLEVVIDNLKFDDDEYERCLTDLRNELEQVKKLIPKVVEQANEIKNSNNQEITAELVSLKNLIKAIPTGSETKLTINEKKPGEGLASQSSLDAKNVRVVSTDDNEKEALSMENDSYLSLESSKKTQQLNEEICSLPDWQKTF